MSTRLFGTPDVGLPVVNFDDTDDAPALLAPYLDAKKALGVDKDWPARFLLRLQELPVAREYRVGSICCDMVRAVKDAAEQKAMIESSAVNDACMAEFAAAVRPASPSGSWPKDPGRLQGPRMQRPQL